MLVIADSGSTKTDWRVLSQGKIILDYTTEGINPYLQDENQISQIINVKEIADFKDKIMEVQFYGAGCAREDKQIIISSALLELFPAADVNVYSDMLGAARGVCGHNSGIVGVLGTGSNACIYDGKEIIEQSISLGYLLGDEGSGVYLGKRLLQEYLYNKLPETIQKKFSEKYDITKEAILDRIYTQYMPNRYMASFSEFVKENLDHPYIYGLLYESFYAFIDYHVTPFKNAENLKINFVGSIADTYEDILKKVTIEAGHSFGTVKKSPLEGLTAYHLHKTN